LAKGGNFSTEGSVLKKRRPIQKVKKEVKGGKQEGQVDALFQKKKEEVQPKKKGRPVI